MTRGIQLLTWIATAGTAGVSNGAVVAWALRQGWPRTTGAHTIARLQTRGLVSVEACGYRCDGPPGTTGQPVRVIRITDAGRLTLALPSPSRPPTGARRTA